MAKTLTAIYGGYQIKYDSVQKRPIVYVKNTKTNASDLLSVPDKHVCSTTTQLRRYLKYLLSTDKLQNIQKPNTDDCCNVVEIDDELDYL